MTTTILPTVYEPGDLNSYDSLVMPGEGEWTDEELGEVEDQ
jgi:hypothetical protein